MQYMAFGFSNILISVLYWESRKGKEKRKKKREHDIGGGLSSKLLTHHIWILPAKIPLHALTPAPTNQKQKREERFI
jgi:hypothetical protein